jgi:hypothetical protein
MSAAPAGADSVTVVMDVGWQPNENSAAKPKDAIARHPKVKKPTAKLKTAADIGWVKKIKKTWMMHLQHGCRGGVWSYLALLESDFFLNPAVRGVIFVQLMAFW